MTPAAFLSGRGQATNMWWSPFTLMATSSFSKPSRLRVITTATFIYATLKCHDIMEAYVKHQFHAHPHVSSVITRHLAANFAKPDQSSESLEAKVTALSVKVDSLTSKLNLYIDKEKEKARLAKEKKEIVIKIIFCSFIFSLSSFCNSNSLLLFGITKYN